MNKFEKPIEYVLNYVLENKFLDEFTVNNARDELKRMKTELKFLREKYEHLVKVEQG